MLSSPKAPDEFSHEAIAQLSGALTAYLQTFDVGRHGVLADAMDRLCTEAHARKLPPEKMLVAIKRAWERLPPLRTVDAERARMAWDRVVSACLEAYFAERPAE